MEATFFAVQPTSLDDYVPLTRTKTNRSHAVQRCPICGSSEIFDLTSLLSDDPAVSRILSCKCGSVLTIFARTKQNTGSVGER
jgi:hypothetical protein